MTAGISLKVCNITGGDRSIEARLFNQRGSTVKEITIELPGHKPISENKKLGDALDRLEKERENFCRDCSVKERLEMIDQ